MVVSQHGHYIGHHLGFFKNFILGKTAANFTEISRKNLQFSILNFNLHN